jgi:hypothetical protein
MVGSLERRGRRAGANCVPFSGRIGRRPLPPGAYQATLAASAAGHSSASVALPFTIVR